MQSPMITFSGIRSFCIRVGKPDGPLAETVLTPEMNPRALPEELSGENQLSPALIGLSPPATGHPANFSTLVGSVLQLVLPNLQPAYG